MRSPSTFVKLRDVAEATGYSLSTVGYVLRGKGDSRHIGHDAQALIRSKAEELGYQGNIFAKALKTGRSGIVAIIGSTHKIPWREHLQFLISRRLQELGFQSLIFDFFWGARGQSDLLRQVASLNPDAIVISRAAPEAVPLIRSLKERGVAMIGSEEMDGVDIDQVALDRVECGYAPVKALLELGHKRIAYTVQSRPVLPFEMRHRIEGCSKALAEAGLPFSDETLFPIGMGGRLIELGRAAMLEKLGSLREKGVTALATFDDLIAFGMIRGAHESGVSIPCQLSIAGGGFIDDMDFLIPSLSSLSFPYERFTEAIISLLSARLDGARSSSERIFLKPAFILRESIARAPGF